MEVSFTEKKVLYFKEIITFQSRYSQTGQRRATEKPAVIHGHLKIIS